MNLSVVYISSRKNPAFTWFFDSLNRQMREGDNIQVILVDLHKDLHPIIFPNGDSIQVEPKPTVWQGKHRLTKVDWWSASNSRNTGICLAKHDFIAFLDDRSVLLPGWLDCVREAEEGEYAVFGAYEKRTGLIVENGIITHAGIVSGEDHREEYVRKYWDSKAPVKCPGEWGFGCTLALPLEWALAVNGYEELCDSLSMEDVIFGKHLENSGYETKYDFRMKIIEDRTPSELGEPMPRTSKERHPHDTSDKGHKALELFGGAKRAQHRWDIRAVREGVQTTGTFPIPKEPFKDWFDNEPLADMAWPWVHPIHRK